MAESDEEFLARYWEYLNWDTDDADFDRLFALARRGAAAEAALADNDLYVKTWSDEFDAMKTVLKDAYTVLAFAFNRIHSLPRSRDTELANDIGRVRKNIERVLAPPPPKGNE